MRNAIFLGVLAYLSCVSFVNAEDPYVYLNWVVEYGEAAPLGVKQRVNLKIWLLLNKNFFLLLFCVCEYISYLICAFMGAGYSY